MIQSWEVGINQNTSDRAYDIVLYSEFNSFDDLQIYQEHPAHQTFKGFIDDLRFDVKVVDYEV